jgi:hypothetical protein
MADFRPTLFGATAQRAEKSGAGGVEALLFPKWGERITFGMNPESNCIDIRGGARFYFLLWGEPAVAGLMVGVGE